MTILSRLFQRGLTPNQLFSSGAERGWYEMNSSAGVAVTTEGAMRAATGKCIRLLADDISQLPLDFYRKTAKGESEPIEAPSWYAYPTVRHWDTWPTHISEVVVSLLSDGNVFLQGLPNAYSPEYLYVFDPVLTQLHSTEKAVTYKYNSKDFSEVQVAHIPWLRLPGSIRALSPMDASRESTGLELAAREWAARFFSNGATLSGLVEMPQGVSMTDEARKNLRDEFATRQQGLRKSHSFGVLTGGATFRPITVTPQQAELNPLWQHVLEEAASIYHIPPHMLASQVASGQSYASVEQKSIEYVVHAVVPIVKRLEATYSRFIPGDDTFVKFNVSALLRGDAWARAQVNAVYLQNKVATIDEVRAREDFPPADEAKGLDSENGGFLETPNNNNGSNSPSAQGAPEAKPDAQESN